MDTNDKFIIVTVPANGEGGSYTAISLADFLQTTAFGDAISAVVAIALEDFLVSTEFEDAVNALIAAAP